MNKKIDIPKNIWTIMNKACDMISNLAHDEFSQRNFCEILDLKIESPIEQAFYIAIQAIKKMNDIPDFDEHQKDEFYGLGVYPQSKIGNYRVDFLLCYASKESRINPKKENTKMKQVIVECDSRQFHDRSEEERSYEKKRDRYLQKEGFKVFRFTGSDILKNPFSVAHEVLHFLTGINPDYLIYESGD